ncbi:hypothetical protein [Halomicrobium urmianum]|uniref:hypothetical protein n=1 Tax=Halomicrobium urmianum TaxID=1586233 RepID=UPI001CDA026D|nr:hypothetical protein [Halomicrobium urmianum]
MSRDLTLVRLDLHWVPAERIARAVPGVSPDDLPAELRRSGPTDAATSPFPTETWTGGPEGRSRRRPGERAARLGEPTGSDPTTERRPGTAAATRNRQDSTPDERRGSTSDDRRHRRHSGETPPPGVPSPRDESDSGGKSKLLVLGGAAVAVLGVLAAAAGFLWKKKSGGDSDGGDGADASGSGITEKIPVVGGDGEGDDDQREEREPRTERGHTSAAPIVGMTALAVMAAFVRRFLVWPRGRYRRN